MLSHWPHLYLSCITCFSCFLSWCHFLFVFCLIACHLLVFLTLFHFSTQPCLCSLFCSFLSLVYCHLYFCFALYCLVTCLFHLVFFPLVHFLLASHLIFATFLLVILCCLCLVCHVSLSFSTYMIFSGMAIKVIWAYIWVNWYVRSCQRLLVNEYRPLWEWQLPWKVGTGLRLIW